MLMHTARRWVDTLMLAVAILGLADATYLTIQHYQNAVPPCTIHGCEKVLTSSYAEIAGIPVALFGAIYYFVQSALLIAFFTSRKKILLILPSLFSIAGFLASMWFVYLQIAVIKAICQYCMVSAVTSTLLFIFGMIVLVQFRKDTNEKEEGPRT